jgi:predicted nuclease of predicted toxin-antitoxin system
MHRLIFNLEIMNLYLDDNTTEDKLVALLRRDGHTVVLPVAVGLSKVSDPRHLTYAIINGHVLVTRNHKDFKELHDLVRSSTGTHPGILVVRLDNDFPRDMKASHIASAIGKVERAGVPVANEIIILNHWR